MLYYNRGYYDNYLFLSFKFKLSLVSFLLFLCILAVSVLWLTVIIFLVLYCIIFFLFWLYLLINNNEVYTKGGKI